MTVRLTDGAISLEGSCPVEDSVTLHQYLVENPKATVEWSECDSMHAAVLQVLLAVRPPMRGTPSGDFVRTYLSPLLAPDEPRDSLRTAGR